MRDWKTPGMVVTVIDDGEIAWTKGYGVREGGTSDSVTARTLFQAASISKPVSAAAALRAVEEGRLSLTAPVNETLASWRIPQNEYTTDERVTLERLLAHTGGLSVSGFPGYAANDSVPSTVQVLDGDGPANTGPVRVQTVPGTAWSYSGGGYTVMQLLLSDVYDRPFDAVVDRLVLDRAGMSESTFAQPLPDSLAPRAARAHNPDGTSVDGRWHTYPEKAAAGLWTTGPDVARFALALTEAYRSGGLLDTATVRNMMTPRMESYGLGLRVEGQADSLFAMHTGSNRGYRCIMIIYPNTGDGVVVMTNGDGGGLLSREVTRSVATAYDWPGTQWTPTPREVVSVSPDQLAEHAGRYRLDSGDTIRVRADTARLYVKLPYFAPDLVFLPSTPDRFFAREIDFNARFDTPASPDSISLYFGDQLWQKAARVDE